MRTAPITVVFVLACGVAPTACGATFTVDATVDAVDALPGDGLCASVANGCTLRAAIIESNASPAADTVLLPAGTFVLAIPGRDENAAATGDLDLVGDVTLLGADVATTIIDGGAIDRVLDVGAADSGAVAIRIERATIRNGLIDAPPIDGPSRVGAGLRVRGLSSVDLVDVDIRDNIATAFGGAAGLDNDGCVRGLRVRFIGNRDPREPDNVRDVLAGAIVQRNDKLGGAGCLQLDDTEISDNHGDFAGAIYATLGAPITIRRGLIAGNSSRFAGALLLNQANTVLLENVTMTGNRGGSGATLNDGFSSLTLRHCTVTANTGMLNFGRPVVGGLGDVHGGFGRTFLSNTIVAGNATGALATDCDRAVSLDGGNVIGNDDCRFSPLPGDLEGVAVALGPLADNGGRSRTHLPGTPAIDHGADGGCVATDQRGFARPVDGDGDGDARCDAGAVELGATPDNLFADGFESPPSPRGPVSSR